MTSRTDYQSITALREAYSPARRGIVSGTEAEIIRRQLELYERSKIELQNIRDMVVMLYAKWSEKARKDENSDRMEMLLDEMSAITCVIDDMKWTRGMEV